MCNRHPEAQIAVTALSVDQIPMAREWAQTCRLPFLPIGAERVDFLLVLGPDRLELKSNRGQGMTVFADFITGKARYRRLHGGGRRQLLARAMGLHKPRPPESILDATAGLGRDAFVLACLGCRVQLYERSAVIWALLRDALNRAAGDPLVGEIAQSRMNLHHRDAREALPELSGEERPEVVYMDPMYPRRERSTLVKKEMRIFRSLVGADEDAPALLSLALGAAERRVVIKRPIGGPRIEGIAPAFSISSRKTRFDVYLIKA